MLYVRCCINSTVRVHNVHFFYGDPTRLHFCLVHRSGDYDYNYNYTLMGVVLLVIVSSQLSYFGRCHGKLLDSVKTSSQISNFLLLSSSFIIN